MGGRVPGLRLGNEDLQSVSTDAKREERINHVKLTRSTSKLSCSLMKAQ
jgi:hypothetical protein